MVAIVLIILTGSLFFWLCRLQLYYANIEIFNKYAQIDVFSHNIYLNT